MSETVTGKIYEAIPAILADVESIGKNRKNQQQGFSFRGIDDVYNAIHPLLAKHKVFPTCRIVEVKTEERTTKSGGALYLCTIKAEYTLWACDGSSVKTEVVGEGSDSGDKSHNKAMSAAYKYALFQLLCIPTEAQDADETTPEEAIPKQAKTTARPKATKAVDEPAKVDDKTPEQRFADASTAIAKATDAAKLLDLAGRCKLRKAEGIFTQDMLQSLLETAYAKAIDLTAGDKDYRSVVLEDIVKTCNMKLLSNDVMNTLEDRAAAKTAA
jgi:hypothetical protein